MGDRKRNILIIGAHDCGTTTLVKAMVKNDTKDLIIIEPFERNSNPFYETETKPFYLTNPERFETLSISKSGKELRRERRKKLRNNKNK